MVKILLVEDDQISRLTQTCLEQNKHIITRAQSIQEGLVCLKLRTFELIIVDLQLPHSIEFCSGIRRQRIGTPVLMITGRATTDNIVKALDSGADDFLSKPFEPRVLLAKARALLRRTELQAFDPDSEKISVGKIELDPVQLELFVNGVRSTLSPTECVILHKLMRHADQTLPASRLLPGNQQTLRTFIKKLRHKLNDEECQLIQVRKGLGYAFCSEKANQNAP